MHPPSLLALEKLSSRLHRIFIHIHLRFEYWRLRGGCLCLSQRRYEKGRYSHCQGCILLTYEAGSGRRHRDAEFCSPRNIEADFACEITKGEGS